MPMTFSGTPPEQLALLMKQGGERVIRRAREGMKREAERIKALAVSNAPIDTGDLESSIKAVKTYEDNRRLSMSVEVSGPADDYALIMHEALAPYGSGAYQLGPKSRAKAAEGHDVGGKYLERAYETRKDKIPETILTEITGGEGI